MQQKCHYDYANSCTCSEDNKCGCDYDNNMAGDFACNFEKSSMIEPQNLNTQNTGSNFMDKQADNPRFRLK